MQQLLCMIGLLLCPFATLIGQPSDSPTTSSYASKSWLDGGAQRPYTASPPLAFPAVREADIMYEKRVWRVIDTREKINQPFRYPEQSLFSIIEAGIENGAITPFSPEDDQFSRAESASTTLRRFNQIDTVEIIDPVSGISRLQVVENPFNPDNIVRWRVQEVWYFDTRYSTMRVRILGLAPLLESRGEDGTTVRYETPMFWINYAEARPWLAQYAIPEWETDHSVQSWEDLFEMRRFSSYIYQENDMMGRRLKDYLSGPDLLQRSEQIEQEIHHFEADVWEN